MLWRIFKVVIQVHRGEQHILAIVKVKPRLVVLSSHRGCRKGTNIRFHRELFRPNQCFDDLLRTVAVVDVKIHDGHSLDGVSVLRFEVSGCHGHVIDKTKTVGASFMALWVICVESFAKDTGVVTRRSCRTKSVPVVLGHHCIARLNYCTGSQ